MNTDRPGEPILHVDMDAFFAAVEQRDNPELARRPVAVGGSGGRGVVAAASYEARAFGVTSAMPMVRARQRCPALIVVAPRPERYRQVSRQVMAILSTFTPLVEPLSLDEAFLDVGGSTRLFGSPSTIGRQIRAEVASQVGLACSVGVGPSKFVAKLLSGLAKPDGILHWPADEVVERLGPLPLRHLWGAGPATVKRMQQWGLHTIGDVAAQPLPQLQRLVGRSLGHQLHDLAQGRDPREVTPHRHARSVSAEETYEHDVASAERLDRRLIALADKVGRRLRASQQTARTVTVKVRVAPFDTMTRSHTLPVATNSSREIVDVARDLLDGLQLAGTAVRLLGVGVSGLDNDAGTQQLALLDSDQQVDRERRAALETITDMIAERFDQSPVVPAASLKDHRSR